MTVWENNVAALQQRQQPHDLLPPCPEGSPTFQKLSLLLEPHPAVQLASDQGRPITLHSRRHPWQEADTLIHTIPLGSSRPLVILGFGLGYHLLRLLPGLPPDRLLVVVEKEPEVFHAALASLDLTTLLTRPHTVLLVAADAHQAIRHLRQRLGLGNGCPVDLWGHPASLRAAHTFYQEIILALTPPTLPRRCHLGLKKERLKILIINPDYFLIPEVHHAFRQLGHEVCLVLFDKRQDRGEEVIARILAKLIAFAPDLVFTINHLGFDREGLLLETCHRLRLPSVSWYVDSPAIILNLYQGPRSHLAAIFVWDPTYIPEVKRLGFELVFPLPLATDPRIFRPHNPRKLRRWRVPVAFVGNSMVGSVAQKLERLPADPEFLEFFDQLTMAYRRRPFRRLAALLTDTGLENHPRIRSLNKTELTDLEAAVIWAATRDYRLQCVQQLAPFRPVIYGDPDWRHLVSHNFQLRPEVNYFDELPLVYGATEINFNATSLQMKAAVNQRVFDVPAAGGFLLTDFREQVAELFSLEQEIVCYHHPEAIPDLVRFYLRHPAARQAVVRRARQRILAEHTYRHRLTKMLEMLRQHL